MAPSMLAHMVLHKLSERPLSGYALCSEIERTCGNRPSYGSIYPLLERLAAEGLVTVKEEGRKKVYSVTVLGKKEAESRLEQRDILVDKFVADIKTLFELNGQDPGPMLSVFARLKNNEPFLGPVTKQMVAFRDMIFAMVTDGRAERHAPQINKMLREMRAKLGEMR